MITYLFAPECEGEEQILTEDKLATKNNHGDDAVMIFVDEDGNAWVYTSSNDGLPGY